MNLRGLSLPVHYRTWLLASALDDTVTLSSIYRKCLSIAMKYVYQTFIFFSEKQCGYGFCVTCCKQRWHLGITSPSSVCLSVCLSVCITFFPSRFLFCNNSSSTDAIEMKLHIFIELKEGKIHNSGINIFGVIPLCQFSERARAGDTCVPQNTQF